MYKHFFKRFFDIFFSFFALIILSPVFLIIAMLVKLSMGSPILYTTKRPGKGGIIFNLHKFRTMTNECDENGNLLPDANRITKLGRFLRKTSIDELPELWDVLRGKMSFIGPRPLSPNYLPYYTEYESIRHNVRPGITGLAQISGRTRLDWEDRFEYDVHYVENLSFFMDVKIFFKTIYKVLKRADTFEREETSILNFNDHRKMQIECRKDFKEIGSEFWLDNKEIGDNFLDKFKNSKFVFSGRTALDYIIKDITSKGINNIYLPTYLCQSIITPFKRNAINIHFYDVHIENGVFISDLSSIKQVNDSALFICDYFFYDKVYCQELLNHAKNHGMIVIHDITHSIFSDDLLVNNDDYYLASLRKWLAITDGAILGKREGSIKIKNASLYKDFTNVKIQAMKRKKNYILSNKGDKKTFTQLYKEAEHLLSENYENKAISCEALDIIEHTSIQGAIEKRKSNAKFVTDGLKGNGNIQVIYKEGSCPIFLPVLFPEKEQRDKFQKYMIEKSIYLPIHWEMPDDVHINEKTRKIYDCIISFVVDQRYSIDDMRRIVQETKRYFEEHR